MRAVMTPQQFVAKWRQIQQKETAVLDWLGGTNQYIESHQTDPDEQSIAHLFDDNL